MLDGPATATLIFILALFVVYRVLSLLAQRSRRTASRALLGDHLAHWQYPPGAWRAYCERERREVWSRYLRPSMRTLPPAAALVAGLAWVAEGHADLPNRFATLLIVAFALLCANMILGPLLRSFLRLSRRRGLDYELYIGASGALEIWRVGGVICATEDHWFTMAGGRIELVEAGGVDPAEIVFSLARPLALGIQHTEVRFLVPEGRLAEARALARSLMPEPSGEQAP